MKFLPFIFLLFLMGCAADLQVYNLTIVSNESVCLSIEEMGGVMNGGFISRLYVENASVGTLEVRDGCTAFVAHHHGRTDVKIVNEAYVYANGTVREDGEQYIERAPVRWTIVVQ